MAPLRFGFIPTEGGRFFEASLAEAVRAEELGFDSVWMEEHHSVTDHYWPSPLQVLAGCATRAWPILLGAVILVGPFYQPVRVGEDVTLLDIMSGGRFTLGIAIGYKPDEFALYGAEPARRGARFEEQLAIVRGLWTEERLTFTGAYYTLEGRLEPRPLTKPHPPVWIGVWADPPPKRAATRAANWIPGPTAELPRLIAGKQRFLDNRAAAGRTEPIREWPLTRDVIIADTNRQARELAERHIMTAYRKEYAGRWRHPFIDAAIATGLDKLLADHRIIAGPAWRSWRH